MGSLNLFQTTQQWEDGNLHNLTSDQLSTLKLASLVVASVSITAALLASYLFTRMRRSFRHDLIMLVIQSDMCKALWFMIYPVVELIHGHTPSKSPFCQVSGFFLTLGIEACDVAVALVAVHTALYIFVAGDGLYAYRHMAYCVFACLPIFLSSLAFINAPGFVNSGEYCYLPGSPYWSSRAISWIPRYVVFAILLATYLGIYIYVLILTRRFKTATSDGVGTPLSAARQSRRRTRSVPPTPRIAHHGLLSSTPSREPDPPVRRAWGGSFSLPSTCGTPTSRPKLPLTSSSGSEHTGQKVRWLPNFGHDAAIPSPTEMNAMGIDPSGRFSMGSAPEPGDISLSRPADIRGSPEPSSASVPRTPAPSHTSTADVAGEARSRSTVGTGTLSSRQDSLPNLSSILRRGPSDSSSSPSILLSPDALNVTGVTDTRERIRRQLRTLLIYPVVYLVVWVVPFVSHILGVDSGEAPFSVVLLSLLSLCIQGTVDSLVFSFKEKPWRHPELDSQRSTFSLRRRSQAGTNPNVGRSRDEMQADNRMARRRREEELAQRISERALGHVSPKNWWDRLYSGSENTN